jgi:hypothetical protein
MNSIKFDKFPDITSEKGFQICAIRETGNDFYYNAPEEINCKDG